MNESVEIIPAILATSEAQYQEKVEKINSSNLFDDGWVQIDLMDNIFVPNLSVGVEVVARYPLNPKAEIQLMVQNPLEWIDDLVKIGVQRIIFPLEVGNTEQLIEKVRSYNIEVGLSLNPETPVAESASFIGKINLLTIMSVKPGFGGQQFITGTFDKVKQASQLREDNQFLIEVDGGVGPENVAQLIELQANNLVIGAGLIDGDIAENLENIWTALYENQL